MPHATEIVSERPKSPSTSRDTVAGTSKTTAKFPRPKKPNYNLIHRFQLPVEIHPLPPLIPHNPLSIIAVGLSYLIQVINPPSQPTYNGYFSSATSSIHITDEKTCRALWEMGFFGKGNLSRSEPTWLAREKEKKKTSELATGKRRSERKEFKLERARKEQQEIEEKLRAEKTSSHRPDYLRVNTADIADIGGVIHQNAEQAKADLLRSLESEQLEQPQPPLQNGTSIPPSNSSSANVTPANEASGGGAIANGFVAKRKISNANGKSVRFSPTIEAREFDLSSPVVSPLKQPGPSPIAESIAVSKTEVENQEHLELSLEEAFFLVYGLGVLKIFCDDSKDRKELVMVTRSQPGSKSSEEKSGVMLY
ncbi:putative trna-splicing endonuclease subunit sen2 [Phaeomoniella chlamydospora]|uniref:tRNA-splicing endonuclease subunit Sen2 n=1 Tax=Phaeomoniella chlamydospora TaxID=158046 RepID=A0A0G2EPF3_PHACM|nr:putative trna-splicing endonuclease subunit sen2 [Phaeomoniella chlamydospora]